jgi:DNA (cytosine-5)-methyltransferase 1
MNYLSVCSGIEAASVAWKDLSWNVVGFSEIEPFPCAVLAHHYPDVINYGDINGHKEWKLPTINLLVGGTPCQSFSIAGLRKGLADPRGNIMLTYLRILASRQPKWTVWENVPGVLSSNSGRDFSTFITSLGNMGYGWAYRVLDAQWFGVAQRRRRVFVVGYLGDASRAAKVLFERESVSRNPAPSREKKQGTATNVADCLRSGGAGGVPSSRGEHLVVGALCSDSHPGSYSGQDAYSGRLIATAFEPGIASRECHPSRFTHEVTSTLRKDMGDNQTAVAMAFHPTQTPISSIDISHTLGTGNKRGTATAAVAFQSSSGEVRQLDNVMSTLDAARESRGTNQQRFLMQSTAVRRLTPTECERLQGFPDGYTNIPWRKKTESPDGPRYKALGNSMAVPVMRWIGERINKVEKEFYS